MGAHPFILFVLAIMVLVARVDAALTVEVLRSVSGLPPHIAGTFEEPIAFQQVPDGPYYVFDRRGHTVYTVDAGKTSVRKLIEIGQEQGRIIQPRGFDTHASGAFVVADAPGRVDRVQVFGPAGLLTGAFRLPARLAETITAGTLVLNGIGSIQYAGDNLLISHPESGALFTEYSPAGLGLLSVPYTYVYDAHGEKVRIVQFRAAGTTSPTSLFFTRDGRLLVTPGCFEFDPGR